MDREEILQKKEEEKSKTNVGRTCTHIVIKRNWVTQNLNYTEREIFYLLLKKASINKPEHSYYVINLDEPYANKIKEIIEENINE